MGMFHICSFPLYTPEGVVEKSFAIRDGLYEDVVHELVPEGTQIVVEDWDTEDYDYVKLQKRGCVWVEMSRGDDAFPPDVEDPFAKMRLPDSYYEAIKAVKRHSDARCRSHPFL